VVSVSIAVVVVVDTEMMVVGRVFSTTKVVVVVDTEMEMLSMVTVLVCISRIVSVSVVTGQVEAAA
jgi:hypothetical protein